MPIVIRPESESPRYVGIRSATELPNVLHPSNIVVEHDDRAVVERRLRVDYAARLADHALDAALLFHLFHNPPPEHEQLARQAVERLVLRIVDDAHELRCAEPVTSLCADVVDVATDELEHDGRRFSATDWKASAALLWREPERVTPHEPVGRATTLRNVRARRAVRRAGGAA